MGYWAKNTCGSTYLFTNTLVSFPILANKIVDFIWAALTGHVGSKLSKMLQPGNDANCIWDNSWTGMSQQLDQELIIHHSDCLKCNFLLHKLKVPGPLISITGPALRKKGAKDIGSGALDRPLQHFRIIWRGVSTNLTIKQEVTTASKWSWCRIQREFHSSTATAVTNLSLPAKWPNQDQF
jgi:hypothetical protein